MTEQELMQKGCFQWLDMPYLPYPIFPVGAALEC